MPKGRERDNIATDFLGDCPPTTQVSSDLEHRAPAFQLNRARSGERQSSELSRPACMHVPVYMQYRPSGVFSRGVLVSSPRDALGQSPWAMRCRTRIQSTEDLSRSLLSMYHGDGVWPRATIYPSLLGNNAPSIRSTYLIPSSRLDVIPFNISYNSCSPVSSVPR